MYDHTLHCGRNHYCRYCLQDFSTAKILKCHMDDAKQRIKMAKKGEYVNFKNYDRKIKLSFMICADFESILLPEDDGKQNPDQSYTNKYQEYVACSYGYKFHVLMINLKSILSHTYVKILFITLLIVWLKKANTAVMCVRLKYQG